MTADRHFEEWEIFAWLDAPDPRDTALSSHLASCEDCGAVADSLRETNTLLKDPDVHAQAARPVAKPDPRRLAAARDAVRRMEEEDAEGARTLAALQDLPIEQWSPYLDARPALRTEGLVRALIAEARADYDRRPERALDLLLVASAVADRLDAARAAAEQRWAVAKERANALRMLGRYTEALDALEWGERFLVQLPVHGFQLALTEWSRATVLFYMTRYAEALPLVRRAIRVFRSFGEVPLVQQARVLEAGIMYEQGDTSAALRIYEDLASYFERTGDAMTQARVWANIAECEMRLDLPDAAIAHAGEALRRYEQLDMPSERTRVLWTLGHQLLRQRHFDLALQRLELAADAFRQLGMPAEVSEVQLDIVEIHVTREAWNEAIPLARELTSTFLHRRTPVHIARAYNYLREAVEGRRATPDVIEYVRRYVKADDSSLPFAPPQA